MSKQLTFSVTFSVLAMAALALGTALTAPKQSGSVGDGTATAHGSLIQVLIRA